ncbi:MAG: phosphatase PAP2 family protein [Thermoleophilaceae bacterium]|nr:phosphatase PAP2 family protein [Thermoleophilaceae bacterium]
MRRARAAMRSLDRRLLRTLRTRGHSPAMDTAVIRLARAGERGLIWYALAACGVVLHADRRPVYLRAIRAVLASMVANTAVKQAVRRRRPKFAELPVLGPLLRSRSYPSAHTTTSFAAARVLSEALPAAPLYGLALAMSLSRPYLGVHYPSDVLAGAVLGDAVAELMR